ncbi:MAG TPA: hypothetical protein VKZ53_14350 [Candidatus Angelobacter sp.]|nr:hypothetical protein [Candidatus Angelobacter sp.]
MAEIDGHDFGAGELNIFLFTENPKATFDKAREFLENRRLDYAVRAAFRELTQEEFVVLWPPGANAFSIA